MFIFFCCHLNPLSLDWAPCLCEDCQRPFLLLRHGCWAVAGNFTKCCFLMFSQLRGITQTYCLLLQDIHHFSQKNVLSLQFEPVLQYWFKLQRQDIFLWEMMYILQQQAISLSYSSQLGEHQKTTLSKIPSNCSAAVSQQQKGALTVFTQTGCSIKGQWV